MAQAKPEDFRIDISHEQSFRYLQAKQYDNNSRSRRLIITDNNIPITYNGNELIVLSLWINGENFSNTTCLFGDDGFPYVNFTESMLSREGDVNCELRIYNSDGITITTTFTFTMTVSKSLLNQDRLVKSSEFNVLNDLILQANKIPDLIKNFDITIEEAHTLIEKIKSDILNYISQFEEMQSDVDSLIESTSDYINELTQAAKDALAEATTTLATANQINAKSDNILKQSEQNVTISEQNAVITEQNVVLSKSWAISSGTGIREDEDTNNSKYFSELSSVSATKAEIAAQKAEQYANFVVPVLTVDFVTGELTYPTSQDIVFSINPDTGNLEYTLIL